MIISCVVNGETIKVAVGHGKQHIRWLALNCALRYQRDFIPHSFCIPQRVLNHEGTLLRPRAIINEELQDGDTITIELRKGAAVSEDLYDEDANWLEDAYGPNSNLRDCKFYWKVSSGQYDVSIPAKVRGDYFVAPKWSSIYSQKDYGGRFEIPVEPVELGDGVVEWVATRKGPPGSCNYKFIMEDGTEMVCKANVRTLTNDQQQHHEEFHWDVPIAEEPNPEVESRPSTASSREGAQQDPQFESDWEALRLKWLEPHMRTRVKDVVTEFYPILIDLFDSYSFMGLELHTSSHTMGMDDIYHLMLSAQVLEKEGGVEKITWSLVCIWFAEATSVKDPRPYISQRVQRHQYLDLLLRMAHFLLCEKSRNAGSQQTPLDEGFFRFITDILMPVMDQYDDDPLRKDAVQQNNLIALQQSRSQLRSAYSYLCQPCSLLDGEPSMSPHTFKFALTYIRETLAEENKEREGFDEDFAQLSGEEKIDLESLDQMLQSFDNVVAETVKYHIESSSQWFLLFWDYFEITMKLCRNIGALDSSIGIFSNSLAEVITIFQNREVELPESSWTEEG